MKMKKETKEALGLSAVFSALVLSVAFIMLAIRKRSITGALLALVAATAGTVGAGLVLGELFALDPDGERVGERAACDASEDAELFGADELTQAHRHLRGIF